MNVGHLRMPLIFYIWRFNMADTLIPKSKYVQLGGKEYQIYPMILGDYAKVERLLSKINDQYLYLNLPTPITKDDGSFELDKNGKVKYDYVAFNAMCELFELALHIPRKEVMNVVDLESGIEILDEYMCISGLKKKILQGIQQIADSTI